MIWIVVLLAAALSVESYSSHGNREHLAHGRQLKIYLVKNAEKLEFFPPGSQRSSILWEKGRVRTTRGRVSGTGSDRRWYIDKVTYEDEGTYTQTDYWNKELTTVLVAVTTRHNSVKCVAGESLYISLEGIELSSAELFFSGDAGNFTVVRKGGWVSYEDQDYKMRVQTHSANIEIRNVNFTDEGWYYLRDRNDRMVSVTRMDLTDHHNFSEGNPLLALLLLLGIPAGICCCCRKKIFKKKATTAGQLQMTPDTVHQPAPAGPVGPCPPYNPPGQPGAVYYPGYNPNTAPTVHPPPGPGQWNGPPPSPGFNPTYPPQNPVYPPAGPAMMPPAQPPQWNGPPPGQYPPGPGAPMGYAAAPTMYSPPPAAGEPANEEAKMENMASSPADPLLTSTAQENPASPPAAPVPPSSSVLNPADNAYKFQIDGDKTSTNFL